MTVGGRTSGSETIASRKSRPRHRVRASHQASGRPSAASTHEVTSASRAVSQKADQSIISPAPAA